MKLKHSALIILFLTATLRADDTEDYLSQHRTHLRNSAMRYTDHINEKRSQLEEESRKAEPSEFWMIEFRRTISKHELYLKTIQDNGPGVRPPLNPTKLKIGMFGTIFHNPYWMDEITPVEVFQVVDERNALIRFQDVLLWVSGMSTSNLADGKRIVLRQVFKVTGTKRYESAGGGSNTVYLLELFDTTRADAVLEKERDEYRQVQEELRKKEADELKKSRTREFADITGKFKVMAEYRGYENGLVILRRTDNDKELRIPLGKLSDKDRAWVSSSIRNNR